MRWPEQITSVQTSTSIHRALPTPYCSDLLNPPAAPAAAPSRVPPGGPCSTLHAHQWHLPPAHPTLFTLPRINLKHQQQHCVGSLRRALFNPPRPLIAPCPPNTVHTSSHLHAAPAAALNRVPPEGPARRGRCQRRSTKRRGQRPAPHQLQYLTEKGGSGSQRLCRLSVNLSDARISWVQACPLLFTSLPCRKPGRCPWSINPM